MDAHVLVEQRADGVLSIMLARPERRNAITVAMYAALADAIERRGGQSRDPADHDRGPGRGFHRRQRPWRFPPGNARAGIGEDIPVWRLLRALAKNQVPIVAAVHGNAVGIGTTMLFHCDFVLAEEGCRFVMPFVDLGLVPEAASSLIFPRLAGRRRAARYLLLGEPFGAAEALELGAGQPCRAARPVEASAGRPGRRSAGQAARGDAPDPGAASPRGYARKFSSGWSWKTAISPNGFSPTRSSRRSRPSLPRAQRLRPTRTTPLPAYALPSRRPTPAWSATR